MTPTKKATEHHEDADEFLNKLTTGQIKTMSADELKEHLIREELKAAARKTNTMPKIVDPDLHE